ncbi:hypothetical protein Tco_1140890 [Tanacetum coccineum]
MTPKNKKPRYAANNPIIGSMRKIAVVDDLLNFRFQKAVDFASTLFIEKFDQWQGTSSYHISLVDISKSIQTIPLHQDPSDVPSGLLEMKLLKALLDAHYTGQMQH